MKIEDIKNKAVKKVIKYIIIILVLILFFKSRIIEHFLTEDNVKTIQFILCADMFIAFLFSLVCFQELWVLISCFRITNYMKKHNIDYSQNVIWWNERNLFLLENEIFISKIKLITFKYTDIESIQIEKGSSGSPPSTKHYYDISFYLHNCSKKIEVYCCQDINYCRTEEYKKVTEIITKQNNNIVVQDMKWVNSFEHVLFD